jgi:hypothetical protein
MPGRLPGHHRQAPATRAVSGLSRPQRAQPPARGRGCERSGTAPGGAIPAVGSAAPDGNFTTVSGRTVTIASLRGHKTLLWFVAT